MNPATAPIQVAALTSLGDPSAAACVGEFCDIPEHHNQAIVNKKLDEDLV